MSPLWTSSKVKQPITNQKRPSPKRISVYRSFAQSLLFCRHIKNSQSKINCDAIKGISLFISFPRQVEASMTVEAAVVLPLFLFFFLNLSCAIELIRLHGNLEFALCDIGNRMAVYGYVLAETGQEQPEVKDELLGELKDVAFSYTYIKNEIINYVGEHYLEESPIADGIKGLQFWESEIFDGQDCFEILVTYKVAPFSNAVGFGSFRMANRYYGHLWNGYHIPGTEDKSENAGRVYIAENGIVYHEDENCSYLFLSVRMVSLQEAYESRNIEGRKYTPCMRCKNGAVGGDVYITEDGDNIHYKKNCAGLKRTVRMLLKEDARKYRACNRCAQN